MATPPTRASYNVPASGNFGSAAASFTTGTFNVTAGDVIVVMASAERATTIAAVTPSASGGSVTWTSQAQQPSATNANMSLARVWTGIVGATATGITVTLARICDSTAWWGFSATVWTAHGGVGTTFSGNNGTTTPSAPSQAGAVACAANSAVQIQVNDWNAADGTSRTWRTINGAAETESLYFRDAAHHTVYGGHRADTGAAGSITQGLTAPSTQRWVAVGVEILGTAGSPTGDASPSVTSAISTAGVVGKVGSAAPSTTSAITTAGAVGKATGATQSVAVGISATGSVGVSTGATEAVSVSITASGSVSGASPQGDAAPTVTSAVTTTGTVGKVGSASPSTTSTVSATGAVGTSTGASPAVAVGITAAGSVAAGAVGDSARTTTVGITATGLVGRASGATQATTVAVTATGTVASAQGATLATSVSITASGSLTSAKYRLIFPTHDEPMRTQVKPAHYEHLTHALSVVKVGGQWRSVRLTSLTPDVVASLTNGVDMFVGGYSYVVDQATSDELIAAGYTTAPIS